MKKIPYKVALMLPTLSPSANLAIYEDDGGKMSQIFKGKAIKARDNAELQEREVKHIGVNEINNSAKETIIEVFIY